MLNNIPVASPVFSLNRLFLAMGLIGAAISGGLAYSRVTAELAHSPAARMSAEEAEYRMLSLCNRAEGPCEMSEPPVFYDETHFDQPPFGLHRKLWQGNAHANGRLVALILNDATGKMASIYYTGDAPKTALQQKIEAPVKTPLEAARIALQGLRIWEIAPAHAEVALRETPVTIRSDREWWVTWRVRDTRSATPYLVKVSLSSKNGNVLTAIDRRGMAQTQRANR